VFPWQHFEYPSLFSLRNLLWHIGSTDMCVKGNIVFSGKEKDLPEPPENWLVAWRGWQSPSNSWDSTQNKSACKDLNMLVLCYTFISHIAAVLALCTAAAAAGTTTTTITTITITTTMHTINYKPLLVTHDSKEFGSPWLESTFFSPLPASWTVCQQAQALHQYTKKEVKHVLKGKWMSSVCVFMCAHAQTYVVHVTCAHLCISVLLFVCVNELVYHLITLISNCVCPETLYLLLVI